MKKNSKRTNLKRVAKTNGKKSIREVITTNATGQKAYKITDPSARLIATIGASMFNEPKYYPTEPEKMVRGYVYDATDIDDSAQAIINTALQIAESDSPRDLLAIAHWARKELNIRTTPQVLLAVAAQHENTKKHVRAYSTKIIQRADELKDVFVATRALFGANKSLPNSLKRGLADAFGKFTERDFLKWEGQNRPTFGDVLKMVDRGANYPVAKPLQKYLVAGEVDDKSLPVIAARKKLAKMTEFNDEAKKLAEDSDANWEVLVSQFGNKKEVWEHLINTKSLPYMATMRNLRNILQAEVNGDCLANVCNFIKSYATKSHQLPYRFLAAKKALITENPSTGWYRPVTYVTPDKRTQAVISALEEALQAVVNELQPIPGSSLVAVDESGSMHSPISGKSEMSMAEAAEVLAGMIAQKGENVTVGAFADNWTELTDKSSYSSALKVADAIRKMGVNGGTNAESVLRWALQNKKKFDRIIILSDMQTYNAGNYRNHDTVVGLIEKYRKQVNPDCKLHCIDLCGQGTSPTQIKDTQTNLVAGFSDKLLNTILDFEGLTEKGEKKEQVFTLEYIRANY